MIFYSPTLDLIALIEIDSIFFGPENRNINTRLTWDYGDQDKQMEMFSSHPWYYVGDI